MIKGLILDVDGVLVGGKKGYNWPLPNQQVIDELKTLRQKGIIVSLCTGKVTFAIHEIVHLAHLDNVHIGDGLTDWNFIEICGYAGAIGKPLKTSRKK